MDYESEIVKYYEKGIKPIKNKTYMLDKKELLFAKFNGVMTKESREYDTYYEEYVNTTETLAYGDMYITNKRLIVEDDTLKSGRRVYLYKDMNQKCDMVGKSRFKLIYKNEPIIITVKPKDIKNVSKMISLIIKYQQSVL